MKPATLATHDQGVARAGEAGDVLLEGRPKRKWPEARRPKRPCAARGLGGPSDGSSGGVPGPLRRELWRCESEPREPHDEARAANGLPLQRPDSTLMLRSIAPMAVGSCHCTTLADEPVVCSPPLCALRLEDATERDWLSRLGSMTTVQSSPSSKE